MFSQLINQLTPIYKEIEQIVVYDENLNKENQHLENKITEQENNSIE